MNEYTVSEGKVFFLFFFNLVLTEGNMQIEFDLKISVYSLGLEIWLSSFKLDFDLREWPLQPPSLFGAMVDGNTKLSNLFCEMSLSRSLGPIRLLSSLRPQIFQGLKNHCWAFQSSRLLFYRSIYIWVWNMILGRK